MEDLSAIHNVSEVMSTCRRVQDDDSSG
jgi:hypothetical protein